MESGQDALPHPPSEPPSTAILRWSARRMNTGFWLVACTLFLLMFAASAPSPLYVVYQGMWRFSPATLTAVFAVHVIALLAALLIVGALSDFVGRRPVLGAALAAEAASMVLFVLADGVGWLYAARIVQGLATGAATGAISSSLIDLERRSGFGALVNSVMATAGLAVGALGTGLLAQYAPAPTRLVYLLLLAAFVLVGFALFMMPEPVMRRPGAFHSLRPHLGVPKASRRVFVLLLPSIVAPWALGGLYLSLGRSMLVDILRIESPVIGGLIITVLTGTGSVAAVVMRGSRPETARTAGEIALVLGVGLVLLALVVPSAVLFFAGTVVCGFGFGTVFLGAFRTVTAFAEPSGRAALVATVYACSYTALSVPALLAGVTATHVGLYPTALVYGALLISLATTALLIRHQATGLALQSGPAMGRRE